MVKQIQKKAGRQDDDGQDKIILIDKPKGITSFDVIRVLRKKLGIRKMGHSGTLDPMATGLLIVAAGKATKKLSHFLGLPKTYQMQVLLGVKTDTGDLDGKVLGEREVKKVSKAEVKKILKQMRGKIALPAPMYSAVKISGIRLYKLARKAVKIKPPIRETEIYWLKLKSCGRQMVSCGPIRGQFFVLDIEMKCSSGTYARAVGEEIGKRLGFPATLSGLRRAEIGKYKVSKAKALEEF